MRTRPSNENTAGIGTLPFLALIAVLFAALGMGFYGFQQAITPLDSTSARKEVIEVRKGENSDAILQKLAGAGAIDKPKVIYWIGRVLGKWGRIKAGEYQVSPSMSPLQIFETLNSGISIGHPFTIREGENIYEIAQELEQQKFTTEKEFLKLVRDPQWIATLKLIGDGEGPLPTLEGYLYPETYNIPKSYSVTDIVRMMVTQFQQVWRPEFDVAAKSLGLTKHQVVTLASVIEKETGAPEERPLISSVFHNRIQRKMRLQSDPTTIYGIWSRYLQNNRNLHRSDLQELTPYNTYARDGLPEGPIANPGILAIEATLKPEASRYLYFVSKNNGTHQFSETLEAHNAAVRALQVDPKAREGKSWRDLNKTRPSNPK